MNRDRLSKARRSWNMSRIRGKDTRPERVVRSMLHKMGYRFRLHVRIPIVLRSREWEKVAGGRMRDVGNKLKPKRGKPETFVTRYARPDIVLPKYKTVIFVHGCFWHRHRGCKNCTTPTKRREWWLKKLEGNAVRDKIYQRALKKLGWRVLVIWECEKTESLVQKLANLV